MTDTRGTFRLRQVRQDILNKEYIPIPAVWLAPAAPNTGYWMGGGPSPVSKSSVDKMNYSTETTARIPGSDISAPKNDTGADGSNTTGYLFYGTNGSGYFSSTEKLVYSTDTRTLGGNMPQPARSGSGVVGNNEKSLIAAGYGSPSPGSRSQIYKYTYSSDTAAAPGLTTGSIGNTFRLRGSGNQDYGYFGGQGGGAGSTMSKLTYSNDSFSIFPSSTTLSVARDGVSSCASETGVYFSGGNPGQKTITDKLTFATEACARIPGANTLSGMAYQQGTGSATKGYMLNWNSTNFEKLTHSTDTYSALPSGASLPVSKGTSFGCVSAQGNRNPNSLPQIRWFDNAEGAESVDFDGSGDLLKMDDASPYPLRNWWDQAWTVEYWMKADAFGQSANGGSNVIGSTNLSTTGEAWSFGPEENGEVQWYYYNGSVQTVASGKTLSTGQWYHLAFVFDGSTGMKIFVDGTLEKETTVSGTPTGTSATISIGKVTSSGNDFNGIVSNLRITHAAVYSSNFTPSGPLTEISGTKLLCCQSSTVSTATIAYNGSTRQTDVTLTVSGDPTAVTTYVTGIASPPTATPTASTTTLRSIGSAPNTGYFGGGDPSNNSSVKRFNFSNETTSTIPATLSQARELTGGTSSITYGYFSGGRSPYYSITDRVTYSNDTAARVPGANTITNIADCMGSGSRTFGILGGGMSPTIRNYAQKLSFADETISNDGSLPEARQAAAVVTEPQTAGYFMGGTTPAGSDRSSVDKFTFSTSTGSAEPSNCLRAKGYQTGMGSLTAGYVTGGPIGGGQGYSDVRKLTYSTSTWTTLSGTTSAGQYLAGGLNNTIFGVFCGGLPSNARTEKVTFATETVGRIPGANWDTSWYRINGAGAQMNSAYATNPNVI